MTPDTKALIAEAREYDTNKCLAFPGLASAMIIRLAAALERATEEQRFQYETGYLKGYRAGLDDA